MFIRFINEEDKQMIWRETLVHPGSQPRFTTLGTLFDPLFAEIVRVDQRVRIPRLHMEFWDTDFL